MDSIGDGSVSCVGQKAANWLEGRLDGWKACCNEIASRSSKRLNLHGYVQKRRRWMKRGRNGEAQRQRQGRV